MRCQYSTTYQLFVEQCCDAICDSTQKKLSDTQVKKINNMLGEYEISDIDTINKMKASGYDTYVCCVRVDLGNDRFFDVCEGYIARTPAAIIKRINKCKYLVHDDYGPISSDTKGIAKVDTDVYLQRKKACANDLMYRVLSSDKREQLLADSDVQHLMHLTYEYRSCEYRVVNASPEEFLPNQ